LFAYVFGPLLFSFDVDDSLSTWTKTGNGRVLLTVGLPCETQLWGRAGPPVVPRTSKLQPCKLSRALLTSQCDGPVKPRFKKSTERKCRLVSSDGDAMEIPPRQVDRARPQTLRGEVPAAAGTLLYRRSRAATSETTDDLDRTPPPINLYANGTRRDGDGIFPATCHCPHTVLHLSYCCTLLPFWWAAPPPVQVS
jgi:hypothetical protein